MHYTHNTMEHTDFTNPCRLYRCSRGHNGGGKILYHPLDMPSPLRLAWKA